MAFITVAGENQIAAKQGAGQTLNIVSFVLAYIAGLGSEPANRVEAMPAAGNIKATLPVTQSGYVNTNQVVYSLVMDSSLGDYDFNWVGLVDSDGVLIAATYTPTIQKRKTTGAVPGNNLTRNFLIAFSGIQATTAIAVPAETWQIDFNARLWGIDERERLSNYDIYGHEGFFGDGWKVTRQGATTTYDVAAGVGYVGGVRIASAVTQQVTVSGPPKSVWLDVSLQGDISDVSAVVDFIIDAVLHNDYTDANGFKHYVTKIADIAADGSVTDVRVNAEFIDTPPLGDDDKSPANTEWVNDTIGKILTKSVAGGANVTLTAVEAGHGILHFTGALTGHISVIVPNTPNRSWIVRNQTTGDFLLTVKTAAGNGVICEQGASSIVYVFGTDIVHALVRASGFGFRLKNGLIFTTNQTLGLNEFGGWGEVQTQGIEITLPLLSLLPTSVGTFTFTFVASQDFTLRTSGGNVFVGGVTTGNSYAVKKGELFTVVANGASWYVVVTGFGSKSFQSSFANPGYQKLPGGFVKQWAFVTIASGNLNTSFSWALAFTTFLSGNVTLASSVPANGGDKSAILSASGGTVYQQSTVAGNNSFYVEAIGII